MYNSQCCCGSGGTGRRARLRGVWFYRTGSTPVSRTKYKVESLIRPYINKFPQIQGYSSVGRVLVSKTMGRGFESFCPCQKRTKRLLRSFFIHCESNGISSVLWDCISSRPQGRVSHQPQAVYSFAMMIYNTPC